MQHRCQYVCLSVPRASLFVLFNLWAAVNNYSCRNNDADKKKSEDEVII